MFWGFLILLLAGGVFGGSMLFDVQEDFLSKSFLEMGVGGAIGVGVGFVVFVYVAGLVYGMSSPTGRKVLMGLGIFFVLFGVCCIMYWDEVVSQMMPFLPSKWLGLPIAATGGLMCNLGSFKE
ncbi:MAG: hypothetical protein VYB35_06615 [Verrucomicrobiota bacterium]|nr:hypothetical protein [Verrucomicrobiota bacterium]